MNIVIVSYLVALIIVLRKKVHESGNEIFSHHLDFQVLLVLGEQAFEHMQYINNYPLQMYILGTIEDIRVKASLTNTCN